jgi:LPS O-antigen subunit length determinant protein (WzzB/FepE family)
MDPVIEPKIIKGDRTSIVIPVPQIMPRRMILAIMSGLVSLLRLGYFILLLTN